jgi:hypothetical protein
VLEWAKYGKTYRGCRKVAAAMLRQQKQLKAIERSSNVMAAAMLPRDLK